MDHEHIEKNHIIDRYLQGQLTEEETDQFTVHSIGCHQCIDQLKMAERMQRGMQGLHEEDPTHFAFDNTESHLMRQNQLSRTYWPLLAAAVFLGMAVLWIGSRTSSRNALHDAHEEIARLEEHQRALTQQLAKLTEAPSLDQPWANPSVLNLEALRNSQNLDRAPSYRLLLDPSKPFVILNLQVANDHGGPFGIRLTQKDQGTLWTQDTLEPNAMGQVVLGLPMGMLAPGDYHIHLFPQGTQDPADALTAYAFQAVRP